MKKSVILGILGLVAAAAPSFGQGFIKLDNYNTSGPAIVYGAGSGGSLGAPVTDNWTVGLYFAPGSVLGDPAGSGAISGAFALATGAGSTAVLAGPLTGGTPGVFFTGSLFQASANPGDVVTFEVVAYNGADYASSSIRGHSAAFSMSTLAGNAVDPAKVGSFMSGFSVVNVVPEPATFTLAGLGAAALLIFRRRK